jgi:hypothetical protein
MKNFLNALAPYEPTFIIRKGFLSNEDLSKRAQSQIEVFFNLTLALS